MSLRVCETEVLHESRFGRGPIARVSDQRDHLVEPVEGDEVPFEDVRAFLSLAEFKLRAASHHFDAVSQEELERFFERKQSR